MALSVPARTRPMSEQARHGDWLEEAVRLYVSNARHYRDNLRRLDREKQ